MNNISYNKAISGFTLIEVLIAAIILFSVLAITSELYSASSLSAKKISSKVQIYQTTPTAIAAIKTEIRKLSENRLMSEFSNDVNILGVNYSWKAQRYLFKARAVQFDDIEPPKPQFGLFNVYVDVNLNEKMKVNSFKFKVATW